MFYQVGFTDLENKSHFEGYFSTVRAAAKYAQNKIEDMGKDKFIEVAVFTDESRNNSLIEEIL